MTTKIDKPKKVVKKGKCMVCKKKPKFQRSVCTSCLSAARRVMAKPEQLDKKGNAPPGKITEQQAMDAGLIGPKERYAAEFNKILKEKFPDL